VEDESMKPENLNGVLQEIAAKFCAYLVRPHFVSYFVLGILLLVLLEKMGVQFSRVDKRILSDIMLPIIFMFILQRELCSHFYKEIYRELVPRNPFSRGSFGIPGVDIRFYEMITSDIGLYRKVAGYIYALSKPITFTFSGFVLAMFFSETTFNK
jgi:hypothetical protein